MRVLAIETATDSCSVAVTENGLLRFEESVSEPRQHGRSLAPMIAAALDALGEPDSGDEDQIGRRHVEAPLDAVAVSAGPGSYTGLRIGVSSAKGLVLALDVPLVAPPTLACLALAAELPRGTRIAAVLPARADEWYLGLYESVPGGVTEIRPAEIATVDDFTSIAGFDSQWVFVTVPEGMEQLTAAGFSPRMAVLRARFAALIGERDVARGVSVDVDSFEPAYLREFVARKSAASIFDKLRF